MIKSYKYKLHPTEKQKLFFEKSFGCCRFVYNWALDRRIKAYQNDNIRLTHIDLIKELTGLKNQDEYVWLKEISTASLQQSIMCMDSAFKNFFRDKKGFPKFKSKHKSKPTCKFVHPTTIRVDFDRQRINLPKVGEVKFFCDRTFDGKIGTVTVSKSPAGDYWVSVLVDNNIAIPNKHEIKEETSVGIDLGIKDFAVLSDGKRFDNMKFLEKSSKKLAVNQKRMARKKRDSNRYNKQKQKVAKIYEKIRNQRHDYLHKVSSTIISENQTVIIEDLNVDGMLKNHCLSKSISSVAWSEFTRMLDYKAEWNGVNVIRIGRFEPSSKMCKCGVINKDLKLSDRTWTCKACSSVNDRDLLAARNIKKFGLQNQNLIGYSPVVSGAENVELLTLVGAVKR